MCLGNAGQLIQQKTVHGEKVFHRAWSLKLRFDRWLSQVETLSPRFLKVYHKVLVVIYKLLVILRVFFRRRNTANLSHVKSCSQPARRSPCASCVFLREGTNRRPACAGRSVGSRIPALHTRLCPAPQSQPTVSRGVQPPLPSRPSKISNAGDRVVDSNEYAENPPQREGECWEVWGCWRAGRGW